MASLTAEQKKLVDSIAEWGRKFRNANRSRDDIANLIFEETTSFLDSDQTDDTPNLLTSLNDLAEDSALLHEAIQNHDCKYCFDGFIDYLADYPGRFVALVEHFSLPYLTEVLTPEMTVAVFAAKIAKHEATTEADIEVDDTDHEEGLWEAASVRDRVVVLEALEEIWQFGSIGSTEARDTCTRTLRDYLERNSHDIDSETFCRASLVLAPPLAELMAMAGCQGLTGINRLGGNITLASDGFMSEQFECFMNSEPSIFHALQHIICRGEKDYGWRYEYNDNYHDMQRMIYSMVSDGLMETVTQAASAQPDGQHGQPYADVMDDLIARLFLRGYAQGKQNAPAEYSQNLTGALAAAKSGTTQDLVTLAAEVLDREYGFSPVHPGVRAEGKLRYHLAHQHAVDPALNVALDIATLAGSDPDMLAIDIDSMDNELMGCINVLLKIADSIRVVQYEAMVETGELFIGGPSSSVPGGMENNVFNLSSNPFATHPLSVDARQQHIMTALANIGSGDRLNLLTAMNNIVAGPETFEGAIRDGSWDRQLSDVIYELERFHSRNGGVFKKNNLGAISEMVSDLEPDRKVLESRELPVIPCVGAKHRGMQCGLKKHASSMRRARNAIRAI